jgi:16S rRNA (guanine527-N7)-methyltransferase
VGGTFLAMKGSAAEEEVEDARESIALLGGEIATITRYRLPDGSARAIVGVKKISHTPPKFPRSPNKITKTPV